MATVPEGQAPGSAQELPASAPPPSPAIAIQHTCGTVQVVVAHGIDPGPPLPTPLLLLRPVPVSPASVSPVVDALEPNAASCAAAWAAMPASTLSPKLTGSTEQAPATRRAKRGSPVSKEPRAIWCPRIVRHAAAPRSGAPTGLIRVAHRAMPQEPKRAWEAAAVAPELAAAAVPTTPMPAYGRRRYRWSSDRLPQEPRIPSSSRRSLRPSRPGTPELMSSSAISCRRLLASDAYPSNTRCQALAPDGHVLQLRDDQRDV
jgi:hypothetical protein